MSVVALVRRSPLRRRHVRRALEIAGSPLLYAALSFARLYRPSFHQTSATLYRASDRLGIYPVIDHYHEPLIRPGRHLVQGEKRQLPAVDLAPQRQLELLARFDYAGELHAIEPETYANLAFPPGDAQTLHNVVRHFRPRRVVEIGSGHSTRFAANALRLNGDGAGHVCVEPYESPWLEELGVQVVRTPVEQTGPELYAGLGPNDVLFIDSSHVIRPQGDVLHVYNQILPSLAPGVLVHVHDVFTPRDYPRAWLDRRWLWNEQYLVEALFSHSDRYRILLAANYLHHDHPLEFARACPVADGREPGSLWFQVA